jgi:carboxyl-terminal processing protease
MARRGHAAVLGLIAALAAHAGTDAKAAVIAADLSGAALMQHDPDAVERLLKDGVYFGPGTAREVASAAAFMPYLLEKDRYADFLTRDEYLQFRRAQHERFAGIGMELERDASGRILCYPDATGPAAQAGLAAGDQLVAIDGQPVAGLALPTVVALAAGKAGSAVTIDVATPRGPGQLIVIRRHANGPSVLEARYGPHLAVRIASFTPNTRQELEFALAKSRAIDPLILDLRGNPGGDFNSAIDCAMLFLKKGDTVASVRGKRGTRRYLSLIDPRPHSSSVYVWQDEGSASAAEAFIAALTENRCAVSIGRTTFGKGTRQEVFRLKSGAALIATTGYLLTPDGREIDQHGLAPDHAVAAAGGTAAFLDAVNRLSAKHSGLTCR